jgi:hypothetical protein
MEDIVEKLQEDEISKYFDGIVRFQDKAKSFYMSLGCSLIFSIFVHKQTGACENLIRALRHYFDIINARISQNNTTGYLEKLINYIVASDQVNTASEFLMCILKTENLLDTLATGVFQLYCCILDYSNDMTPVSYEFNKAQLEKFCSHLGIILMLYVNKEIKYVNCIDDGVILWDYEENYKHAAMIPSLRYDYNGFPFRYRSPQERQDSSYPNALANNEISLTSAEGI